MNSKRWALSQKDAETVQKSEGSARKRGIIATTLCLGTISASLAGLYWFRVASVLNYKKIWDDQELGEENFGAALFDTEQPYDFECLTEAIQTDYLTSNTLQISQGSSLSAGLSLDPKDAFVQSLETTQQIMNIKAYTDHEAAYDEYQSVTEFCEDNEDQCKKGTQWSVVFIANGVMMLLLMLNMCCTCVGLYNPLLRLAAAGCTVCVCLAHWGIIGMSLAFRLMPLGRLCALSSYATNLPSDDPAEANLDFTYEKDGQLILALAIIQLVGSCLCCAAGVYPLRAPQTIKTTVQLVDVKDKTKDGDATGEVDQSFPEGGYPLPPSGLTSNESENEEKDEEVLSQKQSKGKKKKRRRPKRPSQYPDLAE